MKTSFKSVVTFALVIALYVSAYRVSVGVSLAQEPPPPDKDVIVLWCIAAAIIAIEATYIILTTKKKCLPGTNAGPNSIENPACSIMKFQQSSNLVNWDTFLTLTNTCIYDITVTNYSPLKPPCWVRVVAYQ